MGGGPDMAQPTTALSPEWDRWFDETFTNLMSADQDLTRTEFDALIAASWSAPLPSAGPSDASESGNRTEPPRGG
jgi:hypothetical protein